MKKRYKYNVPELTKQLTVGEIDVEVKANFQSIASKYKDKLNKWKFYMYPRTNYLEIGGDADKSWIEGLEPRSVRELYDPDIVYEAGYGNLYIGHAVSYLYSQADISIVKNVITIERGCVYLNDEKIAVTPSWAWYNNLTLNLKKGWNKIEVLFHAGTGQNGFDWSGKGLYDASPLATMYSEKFEESISTNIENTEELELSNLHIKGVTNFNILGEDLWDDNYLLHADALKLDDEGNPYWKMWKGEKGLRFRMDVDEPFTGTGWHWKSVCHLHHRKRAALLKNLTTYTLTYYVHEGEWPPEAQTEYNIWIANSRWALKKTPGLHTLTFKTDSATSKGTAYLLRELYAGPNTVYKKGDRRVYDIEFISLVEGEKGMAEKSNCMYSVGLKEGFSIFIQDCNPILGEYELQANIPDKINKIEENIENNIEKFEITWI